METKDTERWKRKTFLHIHIWKGAAHSLRHALGQQKVYTLGHTADTNGNLHISHAYLLMSASNRDVYFTEAGWSNLEFAAQQEILYGRTKKKDIV